MELTVNLEIAFSGHFSPLVSIFGHAYACGERICVGKKRSFSTVRLMGNHTCAPNAGLDSPTSPFLQKNKFLRVFCENVEAGRRKMPRRRGQKRRFGAIFFPTGDPAGWYWAPLRLLSNAWSPEADFQHYLLTCDRPSLAR